MGPVEEIYIIRLEITIVTSPDNEANVFRIAFLFHPIMVEDNVVNHPPGRFDLLESQPVDAGTLIRLLDRVKADLICVIGLTCGILLGGLLGADGEVTTICSMPFVKLIDI